MRTASLFDDGAMTERIVDMSNPSERDQFIAAVNDLRGRYRFEIKRYRPRRTDRQNRYYFGVIVRNFHQFLIEQGENYTAEDAHEILKAKFLKESFADPRTGEFIGERIRSTPTLDTSEFCDYIEKSKVWLRDMFGVVCPKPEDWSLSEGKQPQ